MAGASGRRIGATRTVGGKVQRWNGKSWEGGGSGTAPGSVGKVRRVDRMEPAAKMARMSKMSRS